MNDTPELSARLTGRLAVVTGAARGNGEAIARGLAAHGARVVVTDLDLEAVSAVAADIQAAGGAALAYQLDVRSPEACSALAAQVKHDAGEVSILVNNAGVLHKSDPRTDDFAASIERQLAVNVLGYANMVHAFVAQLESTRGSIVNIASIMSFVALPGSSGYAASKGAVKQLTAGLALDLAASGVRVNAIAPGFIETRMSEVSRSDPSIYERRLAQIALGRFGLPGELVGPVVFLASEMASYVTGTTLTVDGGYLAM